MREVKSQGVYGEHASQTLIPVTGAWLTRFLMMDWPIIDLETVNTDLINSVVSPPNAEKVLSMMEQPLDL